MKRRTAPPQFICIHHSLTKDNTVLEDTAAIRRYHKETNGWDDIGYHYVIERVRRGAQTVIGRPIGYEGAHCPALNASSIGVCCVGNFDLAPPDTIILEALALLVAELMETYGIPVKNVVFHSDYSSKSCPGTQFPRTGFLLSLAGEARPQEVPE